MELQSLAPTLALLTILEPKSKICTLIVKLAQADTIAEGQDQQTDLQIVKEIKARLPELNAELKSIPPARLAAVEKILGKILTPDK